MAEEKKGGPKVHLVSAAVQAGPATVSGQGFVRSAAKAAATALREYGPLPEDKEAAIAPFLQRAKEKDEGALRVAMYSPDTSYADLGLAIGPLSEKDATEALRHYFEERSKRRGFWGGVIATLIVQLFVAVGAALVLKGLGLTG